MGRETTGVGDLADLGLLLLRGLLPRRIWWHLLPLILVHLLLEPLLLILLLGFLRGSFNLGAAGAVLLNSSVECVSRNGLWEILRARRSPLLADYLRHLHTVFRILVVHINTRLNLSMAESYILKMSNAMLDRTLSAGHLRCCIAQLVIESNDLLDRRSHDLVIRSFVLHSNRLHNFLNRVHQIVGLTD